MFEHPAVRLKEVKNIQATQATIVGQFDNGNYFSTNAFDGDSLLGSANVNGETQFNFDADLTGQETGTFEIVVDGLTDGNTVEVAAAVSDPGGPLAKSDVYEFTAGDTSTEFVNEFDDALEAEVEKVHAIAESGRGNRYEMSSGDVLARNIKSGKASVTAAEFFVNIAFDNPFRNEPTGNATIQCDNSKDVVEDPYKTFSRRGVGIKAATNCSAETVRYVAIDSDNTVSNALDLGLEPGELAEKVL